MEVALITGHCPPGVCGVGDYASCLASALAAKGVAVRIITSEDWRVAGALKIHASVRNADLVHIQYPTLGFGYRLGPQALSLLRSSVVTIHEASQRHILRKLSLLPFFVRPKHTIFTTDFERQFVTRRVPWVSRISSVIPIPSNIRQFPEEKARAQSEIAYFGLILPRKGLEQVVEVARLIKSSGLALTVRITGSARPEHLEYLAKLRSETSGLPVVWDLNLSEERVAEKLATSAVAYLPFPDGASERRSSLKAALANGAAVITTLGPHTPEAMKGFLRFARSPREALLVARSLLDSPQERISLASSAAHYLEQCTWERVAELHFATYQRLLCSENGFAPVKVKGVQDKP